MSERLYFETTNTTKTRGYLEIDTDFTQVYHCMTKIAPFINSATTWKLLFWALANESNKSNGLSASKDVFERFNKYLYEACNKCSVTYRTFQNCIDELVKAQAITKVGRGRYYFNPHVFWQDNKGNRKQFLIDELKEKRSVSHNPNGKSNELKEDEPEYKIDTP